MDLFSKKIALENGLKYNLTPVYEYKVIPEFEPMPDFTFTVENDVYTTRSKKYKDAEFMNVPMSFKDKQGLFQEGRSKVRITNTLDAREHIFTIPIFYDDPEESEEDRLVYALSLKKIDDDYFRMRYNLRFKKFRVLSCERKDYYNEHKYTPYTATARDF